MISWVPCLPKWTKCEIFPLYPGWVLFYCHFELNISNRLRPPGYYLACGSPSSCLFKLEKGLFYDYLNNSSVLNFKETPPENSHSRKRREVHIEVTMEVSGVENENDFHEFQLRHHHSKFRRDAAVPQQCGPLKCGSKYQTYGFWGLCLTKISLHRLWQSILARFSGYNRGMFCCGLIFCSW